MSCLHEFIREGYYGGRVEVLRSGFRGPGFLYYGDVNSMYPWAMLGTVPTELAAVRDGNVDINRATRLNLLGFVECSVSIPSTCYLPPLPYRHDGKLIFPVGEFNGVWTSAELANLQRVGGSVTSYRRSVWFRGRTVFSDYVNHWYRLRDKSNPNYSVGLALCAKFFLNNLYGKFGMTRIREKLHFNPTDDQLREVAMTAIADPIFGAYVEQTITEPSYVIPQISAWITARARLRLWSLMMDMLDSGHKVYYCDTDSIIGTAPVSDSPTLGDLKLECLVSRAMFAAPKMYYLEKRRKTLTDKVDYIKAKGFSGGFGAKGLTESQFNRIVNHIAKVRISRMRKLKEGMRDGQRFPAMAQVEKGVKAGVLNNKRVVLPDGNTSPIVLKETPL